MAKSERQDVKTDEREILRARVIELENALADIAEEREANSEHLQGNNHRYTV